MESILVCVPLPSPHVTDLYEIVLLFVYLFIYLYYIIKGALMGADQA